MTDIVAKMDSYGRGAWIAAMILGFIVFWPVGLALLFFLIWSGRMGCGKWKREKWARGKWNSMSAKMRSSGNAAFDEYKAETIRRLEEEQEAFTSFLEKLRMARDKAEFEDFMASRRSGSSPEPDPA